MDASDGSVSSSTGFMDKRRRSSLIRRPRDIKGSLQSFTLMPPSTQPHIAPSNEGENTLKLNLKLGGAVTRTIQTNSEAGIYTKVTNKVKGSVPAQRCVQKTMYLGEIHQSMTEKNKRGLKKRLLEV
ncbi:unnamed protein product [Eruca vesicaria subsp. sativa]|uniref:Uncharacterized protein n=1 Tax=Eruca vesicaria subsp. sativa TaxID=29727 RepID=A0ABC8IY16_ERUVS|nr:unnamed protein product [Eruca vesicaria subsp. sativa]